ncbi:hypothetical protein BDA96_10G209100 [Sorghum bicolor]|uniref:Factor of DNA methylation 1-5/IDN2 domain-containing protein n=1 Tax=Sorghum bicolor TaxID=4558 RepID=A0A921Q6C1_SORBI|nr:hypothetical protein BDA96_10G209100 [Sorghum bicolor]
MQLKENADKMEGIESMNTDLFIKERNNNEELQCVWKELLDLQQEIQNSEWYPFKIQVVDEKQMLKADHGEEIYGLVTKGLCEIIKYNASGCYTVNELWNYKEDHKVSPDEVVQYIVKK